MTRTQTETRHQLLEILKAGGRIVTASNRQADFLHQLYREHQQAKVWRRADILTYQEWLANLIEDYHMQSLSDAPVILGKNQTRYLWRDAINDEDDPLLNTNLAARKACRAAEILHAWLATDSLEDDFLYEHRLETKQFRHWYRAVASQCQKNSQTPYYQTESYLLQIITEEGLLSDMKTHAIHVYGFQEPTPIQVRLFDVLSENGLTISSMENTGIRASVERMEFGDINTEITHAAEWAHEEINKNPKQRIGIIVPELEQHRDKVRRSFSKVFNSNYWLDSQINSLGDYDISLAPRLVDYPMVQDALLLFKLVSNNQKLYEFIRWIQSPYLSTLNDAAMTQALIELAQAIRYPEIKRKQFSYLLTNRLDIQHQESAAKNQALLDKLKSIANDSAKMPSDWVQSISDLLQSCDFAPEAKLSSIEYQTRQALYKAIEGLSAFDMVVSKKISWLEFLDILNRELATSLFQPQTGHCAIQIMGVFEALSIEFDQIRMLGVDNNFWPAKTSPNPFLPFSLQQDLDMPNASTNRELELCEIQYQSLQAQCDYLLLSHINDSSTPGESLSPIVQDIPLVYPQSKSANALPEGIYEQRQTLRITPHVDDHAARIVDQDIKGGSSLIKDIAQCPFRAFVHFRLKVKSPDDPKSDFDAMDKGNLVHEILETLWRDDFNFRQETLKAKITQPDFENRLVELVHDSVLAMHTKQGSRFESASIALEEKRLLRVIKQWLAIDAERDYFEVYEIEKLHKANLHDATIHLKIDRVDKLDDGRYVIIDYKTGKVEIKHWFAKRPEEPQLPLYAHLLHDDNKEIAAVTFAVVRHDNCEFKGVSDEKGILPGIKQAFAARRDTDAKQLADQIPLWQASLETLMQEYLSGFSAVKPKDEKVCEYCDLKSVCRITEIRNRPVLEAKS